MKISSPDFKNNEYIPRKFTCLGDDISPSLNIEDIPKEARSLALIVDDPDAPMGTWVHWVLFNIPIVSNIDSTYRSGVQGINDFGKLGYGGPCPPSGLHRYFFKLYALDTKLAANSGATKEAVLKGMEGHILAKAELIGLYKKG